VIQFRPRDCSFMANALTAVRLLLIVPFALLMARGGTRYAVLAALMFAAAVATDLLDGPLARRRGTASAAGGIFDHTVDFLFVTSGLAAGASRGAFPWILPVLVATTLISMAERLRAVRALSREARESPGEEREGPSPR